MKSDKSSYKLKNLQPIFWINIDSDIHRCEYMENQFSKYSIDAKRISAYDGREDDLSDYLHGSYPGYGISSKEIGCTISHLKSLKYWIDNYDTEYAIICEDDLDITTCEYWNFTWDEFLKNLPPEWDCIQTSAINGWNYKSEVQLHKRYIEEWSTSSYLIKRNYAEKIVNKYCKGDLYNISIYSHPHCNKPVADNLVYIHGNVYTVNIFSYNTDFPSNIHEDHLNNVHRPTRKYVLEWWEKNGKNTPIEKLLSLQ